MKYKFTLGKDFIYHCKVCNVPLIGKYCGTCGKKGEILRVSPPGDIRIASEKSIAIIKKLFKEDFGVEFIEDKIVLLNRIQGIDKTDEIIIDGRILGVISYNLKKMDYKLELKLDGAKILASLTNKKTVIVKKSLARSYLKDRNILKKDIIDFDKEIKEGDNVIVKVGKLIGIGEVKIDLNSAEAKIKIKDISIEGVKLIDKKVKIEDIIKANAIYLEKAEEIAIENIKRNLKYNLPIIVSFSGGMNSIAVLEIAKKSVNKFDIIFIDTGLEFPETVNYVKEYCKNVIIGNAGNVFWENIENFGVPTNDYRWCCRLCKLAPLSEIIEQRYQNGCYTIEGKRGYESSTNKIGVVEKNQFILNQVLLNPIRNWKAIDVFLYILWKGLPYNKLQEEDFLSSRCYVCPSFLVAEFENMKETHPELYKKWKEYLYKWAEENGLNKDYIDKGFWRWISQPNEMKLLAKELGIEIKRKREEKMKLVILKRISPCITGGYDIDAILSVPANYSYKIVANAMSMVGLHVIYSENLGGIIIKGKDFAGKVFASGNIYVVSPTIQRTKEIFGYIVKTILMVQLCTECEICVRTCKTNAIKLKDGTIIIDRHRCHQCMKCYEGCAVAKYYDRLIEEAQKNIIS